MIASPTVRAVQCWRPKHVERIATVLAGIDQATTMLGAEMNTGNLMRSSPIGKAGLAPIFLGALWTEGGMMANVGLGQPPDSRQCIVTARYLTCEPVVLNVRERPAQSGKAECADGVCSVRGPEMF